MVSWTPRKIIIAAVLVTALAGGIIGLDVTHAARPHQTPQIRDFYLFTLDQGFDVSQTTGLKADYAFLNNRITVDQGDTLMIHFYNPTDAPHTFTMGSPYANDVILPGTTSTTISTANITIIASQAGIFHFYCRFHGPSMSGDLVVLQA